MAHAIAGVGGSPGPRADALSAVYLLAVDSINDLHGVPLDADQPPGPEDPVSDCPSPAVPDKEAPPPAQSIPGPPCGPRGLCSMRTFIGFLMIVALANIGLLLYILYLNGHQDRVLQALTQRLDAQTELLRQMASNPPGSDPREM